MRWTAMKSISTRLRCPMRLAATSMPRAPMRNWRFRNIRPLARQHGSLKSTPIGSMLMPTMVLSIAGNEALLWWRERVEKVANSVRDRDVCNMHPKSSLYAVVKLAFPCVVRDCAEPEYPKLAHLPSMCF